MERADGRGAGVPSPSAVGRGARGLTIRSAVIAFGLLILFAPTAFYGELVYSTTYAFATGVPAMAPLVVLFLLIALNWLPRRVGLTVAAIAAGAAPLAPEGWSTSAFPAPPCQGGGAVLALALWMLWSGRRHLARAVRLAFGSAEETEAREPLTYRWALIGFLACMGYLVCSAPGWARGRRSR